MSNPTTNAKTSYIQLCWKKSVNDFLNHAINTGKIGNRSIKSYRSYLNGLDKFNNGMTITWIQDAMNQNQMDPITYLINLFNNCVPQTKGTYKNWQSALKAFGEYMIGHVNAPTNLGSIKYFDDLACEMIAKTAIFCDQDIVIDVIAGGLGANVNKNVGNPYASWFNCNCRRITDKEKKSGLHKGNVINGIMLDDNSNANLAIKKAVLEGMIRKYGIPNRNTQLFKGYEACHIWDGTAYDEHFYTSLTNIVLIPRAIAGLTDHCTAVKGLLQYESFKRFGKLNNIQMPVNSAPNRPTRYSKFIWR